MAVMDNVAPAFDKQTGRVVSFHMGTNGLALAVENMDDFLQRFPVIGGLPGIGDSF